MSKKPDEFNTIYVVFERNMWTGLFKDQAAAFRLAEARQHKGKNTVHEFRYVGELEQKDEH